MYLEDADLCIVIACGSGNGRFVSRVISLGSIGGYNGLSGIFECKLPVLPRGIWTYKW